MSDAYDMTLVFALLALIAGLALWCLWNAGRIVYQWYRDNRPRRMATRLPRPSKDATRYMTPGSL